MAFRDEVVIELEVQAESEDAPLSILTQSEDDKARKVVFVALSLSIIFMILYLFSPSPRRDGLQSWNTAELLWTPAIPIILSISIAFFVFATLWWKLDDKAIIIGSTGILFLTTMGHQLGVASPIGSDGWFFLELAQRHLEFGSTPIIDGYLTRPGALFLVEWVWWLLPDHAPLAAALIGILLSISLYLLMTTTLLRELDGRGRWIPIACAGFAGMFLSGWNPAMYSAQLLSIVLWYVIVHFRMRSGAETDLIIWIAILLLSITHIFTPLILLFVLLAESRFDDCQGRSARWLAFGVYFLWFIWSITVAADSTLRYLDYFGGLIDEQTAISIGMIVSLALFIAAARHPGKEKTQRIGVRRSSVIIGVLAFSPILYLMESALGAQNFLPRMLIFMFIPVSYFLCKIPAKFEFEKLRDLFSPSKGIAVVLMISILVGVSMGFSHSLWVQRSLVMPEETADCWDAAKDVGIWSLVDENGTQWQVIHSPQLRPPTGNPVARDLFESLGESDYIVFDRIGAVIETVDMVHRSEVENLDATWQTWDHLGGVPGSCKILVRPSLSDSLSPGVWG